MSRANLLTETPEVPLSVTAVSVKLGVSASTLRTWERRYGLGPDPDRRAGSHRRYRPEDVARLARMVELIRAGASPASAAEVVLAASAPHVDKRGETPAPGCSSDLVAIARDGSLDRLSDCLESAIAGSGLVHTYSRLVGPALDVLRSDPAGETPGIGASTTLTCAFLSVLNAVYRKRPAADPGTARRVALITDEVHALAGQVVGVALAWYGLDVKTLTTESVCGVRGDDRFRAHMAEEETDLVVVMGSGASCGNFVTSLTQSYDLDVVLVGADTPRVLDGRVLRVRTAAACVEEVVALLVPGAAPGPVGEA